MVGDGECTLTVDTGSNISIIHPEVIQRSSIKATVQPVESQLRTVTGETAPILGITTVPLTVGTFQAKQRMWVANIADECILGLDFLQQHNCQVDLKKGVLHIGNEEVPLQQSQATETACCRCYTATPVTIPPNSEMVVRAKVEGEWRKCSKWAMLQPDDNEATLTSRGVLVGKTLVDLQTRDVPVRMVNLSELPQHIRRGTALAKCEPVLSVVRTAVGAALTNVSPPASLPPHVRSLYEKAAPNLLPQQQQKLMSLLYDYANLFSQGLQDLGQTDLVQHNVNVGDAQPLRQSPRRLPLVKRKEAEKAIVEMEQQGLIEPSDSPWSSPVVLVKKKDGSLRFCVDYRQLNRVTRKDSYPLPRVDDALEALAGMKWFSTLDLRSGYWQVKLDEMSKEKTAFSTGSGLWQFKVMPFGLCNAPATFERLMERVLKGLPWRVAMVYIDDILVSGGTFEEHLANLRMVFERLRTAKLKLSPGKCDLFQPRVGYLGHILSANGISTDPRKTEAVSTWPPPASLSELRSFLGLCSYYRRFIASFAAIAKPLHKLLEAGQAFEWTSEMQQAFQELKERLVGAPILSYPLPDAPFTLDTDASSHAIGGVLSQIQDGQEKVIAYYSQTLSRPQKQYCVTRRELLAVIKSVQHFHHYLYGRHFTVRTDHAALSWLLSFRNPEGQIARWIQRLQEYDFEIQHRPGLKHNNADALSRRPCLPHLCKHCDRQESKEREATLNQVSTADTEEGATELKVRASWIQSTDLNSESTLDIDQYSDLRHEQTLDPDLKPVLLWKEESSKRPDWSIVSSCSPTTKHYWSQWRNLKLINGVLHRLWETPSGDRVVPQMILPRKMRKEVFAQLHSTPTAGHLGVNKTSSRIRQRFYWPHCLQDVKDWCEACDLCASRRGPTRKQRAPMHQYNVGAPSERIALDVLGPLPSTTSGNKYVLLVADYFTKWPEAFPIPNQEAVTVAEVLVKEYICRFGVPVEIHSDQGRNFESNVIQEMCSMLGIRKTRTTPLHPQSDGMVERMNRTLEAKLSKFVDEHQQDWDHYVPFMMMSLRSAIHETTKCSPAMLHLGHELRLPVDLLLGRPEEAATTTSYCEKLQERLEQVHSYARENLKVSTARMKNYYDLRADDVTFAEGDAVWLHNPRKKVGHSPKLMRSWEGPYTIIKVINDVVCRIKLTTRSKAKVVHRNRLWKYAGENPPTWFSSTKSLPTNPDQEHLAECTSAAEDNSSGESRLRRSTRQRKTVTRFQSQECGILGQDTSKEGTV